jgi:tRNA pseudouridine38-40 synthase
MGRTFAGWQRQDGFETVQEHVERAFATIFGKHIAVYGAGRTDSGVHALGQAAHETLPEPYEPDRLVRALNGNLPPDIGVCQVRPVPDHFHARFSARAKRYLYRYLVGRQRPVFSRDLFHWVRRPLNLTAMREAAVELVGEHDFAAFASNPGQSRNPATIRRVDHLHLIRRPWGIDLFIQGGGFLYNMVRAIAGTLQDVGMLRYPPRRVAEILAARDRRLAGMTAPARGLYLLRVLYPQEILGVDPR